MSKITNDDLTWSGTHKMLYSCTHMTTVGVKLSKTSGISSAVQNTNFLSYINEYRPHVNEHLQCRNIM